jgi:hypothetical protein
MIFPKRKKIKKSPKMKNLNEEITDMSNDLSKTIFEIADSLMAEQKKLIISQADTIKFQNDLISDLRDDIRELRLIADIRF